MKIAALILGIIGGLFGLILGLGAYGLAAIADHGGVGLLIMALPVACLVGAGLAISKPTVGGALMLGSALMLAWILGVNGVTAIPLILSGLGGILGLWAGLAAPASTTAANV